MAERKSYLEQLVRGAGIIITSELGRALATSSLRVVMES
jgi:hypothetical protein